jgi:methanethiol S-methyltransferase
MQTKTQKEVETGRAARVLAILCVLAGLGGQATFTVFVILLGLDALPERAALPGPWPWVVDIGWLVLFAVQHSGMARHGFKRAWVRLVPPALERGIYVAVSGLLLLGLTFTWQPLPGEPLWHLPAWFVVVSLTGLVGGAAVMAQLDQGRFFGLRQVSAPDTEDADELRIVGPYRYVRHPLMTCTLVSLWGLPVMSPTLALLSGGLTMYILLALRLEESELQRRFGTAYAEYRHRVPALLPWRLPVPRAIHHVSAPF